MGSEHSEVYIGGFVFNKQTVTGIIIKCLNRTRCSDFENKPVKEQLKISICKTLMPLGIKMLSVNTMTVVLLFWGDGENKL